MKLEEYLKKHQLSLQSFGKKVGASQAQISRIVNKKRNPSTRLIERIIRETKGEVSFEDVFHPEAPSGWTQKGKNKHEKN